MESNSKGMSSRAERAYFFILFGISGLTVPIYIKIINSLKTTESIKFYTDVSSIGNRQIEIFVTLGFYACLSLVQHGIVHFFIKDMDSDKGFIFGSSLLFVLLIFTSNSLIHEGTTLNWLVGIFLWVLFTILNCYIFLRLFKIMIDKFRALENKEQFTIGFSILTFILGLLLAK